MKNILITGGLGFVGQHLVNALVKKNPEYNITILDRIKTDFFNGELNGRPNIKIVSDADITRPDTIDTHFRGIDAVFHAAAMVSFWRRDKKALYNTNINGTENIISLCRKHKVKRLIYVSSTAALGYNNDENNPADEAYRYDWNRAGGCYYMLSKYHAEQKVKEACREGFPAVIANPSTMFGPWDRKIFPLIENLLSGSVPAMLPGGFSIIDVRDTVSALVAMLEKGTPGENHLLVGGNYTYRDMLTTLAGVLNARPPAKTLPKWLGTVIVPPITFLEMISSKQPKLTKEILAPGFKFRYYTCKKAENELGWKAEKTLEETFRDAYEFYKNYAGKEN